MKTAKEKAAERKRAWYLKNKELTLQRAKIHHEANREKNLEYYKQWRNERLEEQREKSRQWKANNRERHRESSREYGRKNAAAISAKLKEKRRALKQVILDAYGNSCACCGETLFEFLTLDHIENDGAAHRRELKANGRSERIYNDLIARGFPTGFRILCFNCNSALGFYGYCPHPKPTPQATDSEGASSPNPSRLTCAHSALRLLPST